MANEEILKKAIEKALQNGWLKEEVKLDFSDNTIWQEICYGGKDAICIRDKNFDSVFYFYSIEEIIFNHDFAKAFWGSTEMKDCKYPNCDDRCLAMWQYHLQQMIIKEDPVKYLEQFL